MEPIEKQNFSGIKMIHSPELTDEEIDEMRKAPGKGAGCPVTFKRIACAAQKHAYRECFGDEMITYK